MLNNKRKCVIHEITDGQTINTRVLWDIAPPSLDRSVTWATPLWPLSMLEALCPIEHSRSLTNPFLLFIKQPRLNKHCDWSNRVHYNSIMHAATSHACIISQHMHATYVNSDFESDKISRRNVQRHVQLLHNTLGADKFESASRRKKKVNCLNFTKFFQLCVSLLEMISILVDCFRFLSLVVIQILNQQNLSWHM